MVSPILAEARSAREVADVAELVEQSIAVSGEPDRYAVEALERIATAQFEGADTRARQGFQALGESGAEVSTPGETEVLAAVVTQLAVGNTLLAAGRAVGEGDTPPDAGALAEAVADLNLTAESLERLHARSDRVVQGLEAAAGSSGLEEAVAGLRSAAEGALDQIAQGAAGVAATAFAEAAQLLPDRVRQAVQQIGERIDLGSHVGRLLRLGLRAVQRALDLFTGMFPQPLLQRARTDVDTLYQSLTTSQQPGAAVVGWLVRVHDARRHLAEVLGHPVADVTRVDAATVEVERLRNRFGELVDLAGHIVKGTAAVGAALGLLHMAIPHLPLIIAGALVLVVAGVVLLADDYVEARGTLGFVRGIRQLVSDVAG